MSLTVSIPSSLAVFPSWKTEDRRSNQDYRLRDQGLTRTKCPICGHRATLEEVTVQRPGQPTVRRQMLRCRRQVPLGANSYRDKGTRCPVQVISEAPIDQDLPAVELHIEVGRRPAMKPCEQCGTDILDSHGRRFCKSCSHERKLEGCRRKNAASEHAYKHPCPRCGKPCVGTQCWDCYVETAAIPDCAPPPLPEPEAARSCLDCNRSIEDRPENAIRCVDCAGDHKRRTSREAIREKRAAERLGQELPPEPPQEPAETTTLPEPPPKPPEALQEHPGPKEEHEEETSMETSMDTPTPTRTSAECAECGANIEHRTKTALYCVDCASERARSSARESQRIRRAIERREREAASKETPAPSPAPVLAPPSRALRLSVVDLAQQVRCLEPSARDLVWDVASLSPERMALLRRVLADSEEVCA